MTRLPDGLSAEVPTAAGSDAVVCDGQSEYRRLNRGHLTGRSLPGRTTDSRLGAAPASVDVPEADWQPCRLDRGRFNIMQLARTATGVRIERIAHSI